MIGGDHADVGDFDVTYEGDYFFADFGTDVIYRMVLDEANLPLAVTPFATETSGPVYMSFGPDGALYYAAIKVGQVRKIEFVGGANTQPVAVATATPDNGPAPLMVQFDGSDSGDGDGDSLSYLWDLDDGGQTSTLESPIHTYTMGVYGPTLTVDDGNGGLNSAPQVRIVSGRETNYGSAPAKGRLDAEFPFEHRVGELRFALFLGAQPVDLTPLGMKSIDIRPQFRQIAFGFFTQWFGQERDVEGFGGHHLRFRERLVPSDRGDFLEGSEKRRYRIAQILEQMILDLPPQRHALAREGLEDHIAAGEERLHRREPQRSEELPELLHLHPATDNIDRSQKGDVLEHGLSPTPVFRDAADCDPPG